MTTPIPQVTGNNPHRSTLYTGRAGPTGAQGASDPTGRSSVEAENQMDKDMFLKLLVAQLKYQDPGNPINNQEFVSQTAQFTMVEKLNELATGSTSQLRLAASNLIGRTVTAKDASGTEIKGVVTLATFADGDVTLRVGTNDVPLSTVETVTTTATA